MESVIRGQISGWPTDTKLSKALLKPKPWDKECHYVTFRFKFSRMDDPGFLGTVDSLSRVEDGSIRVCGRKVDFQDGSHVVTAVRYSVTRDANGRWGQIRLH